MIHRDPVVQIQSLSEALVLNNSPLSSGSSSSSSSSTAIQWVLGTPPATETEETDDPDQRQFWMVLDSGAQLAVTYSDNNVDDNTSASRTQDGSITDTVEWEDTDSADRPLVVHSVTEPSVNGTTSMTSFLPLPAPVGTSPWSGAVPTPSGGWLLVEQTAEEGTYQVTQLNEAMEDITHESLRSQVSRPLPDTHWAYSFPTGNNNNVTPKWALYSQATNRYNHAVIGDALEGNALTVLQWNDDTQQVEFFRETTLVVDDNNDDDDTVFEGLGPMWADVDGDGHDDLITTVSNSQVGARLRIYRFSDSTSAAAAKEDDNDTTSVLEILAQAPAIGLGGRWLHQLAVGPLGPNGEQEIVEIRTPHIGGIVRYYRYQPSESQTGSLQLVASTTPFTSHDIRSRNLDRVVVGDFNGDGIPELVVQNQRKDTLVGIQRSADSDGGGTETVWSVPLPSPVQSNLGVSCSSTGIRELVFGTRDAELMRLQFQPASIGVEGEYDLRTSASGSATSGGGVGVSNRPGISSWYFCILAILWFKAFHCL